MLVSLPGGKLIPGRELAHPTANVLCSSRMLETSEADRPVQLECLENNSNELVILTGKQH
jgi:hypothetical protein